MTGFDDALERAARFAPFLAGAIARHPAIVDLLASGDLAKALDVALAPPDAPLARALRLRRDRLALVLAIGDLAGALSFEEVVARLSAFADDALDAAIAAAGDAQAPGAGARGFAAIALGKHGSRELNYSSDIDPILLYDPALVARRARDEPAEAAARIARGVVETLQRRDADGHVFRVDLRLRPAAEVTPPALPVDAAIAHYESSALAWERAAFIRARAAAGDRPLGTDFLATIAPFVWRRSLDFGAIDELRTLTHRIRAEHSGTATVGPGFDLKRGRGGIREVEFLAQIHQLIHGGRNPALRAGATLDALAALAMAGVIGDEPARRLGDAYRVLRTIEHRLQMVDDRQTHVLPDDPGALDAVARLHGLDDGPALVALLRERCDEVATLYDALAAEGGAGRRELSQAVARFDDPEAVRRRIEGWQNGRMRCLRSPAALRAFDEIAGALLDAIAATPDPASVLTALETLLERLSSGVNLFRLLGNRPRLLDLLIAVLAHAPALAEALSRRPALLDRLVDVDASADADDVRSVMAEIGDGGPLETVLDRAREVAGEHRFALGVGLIEGRVDPLVVAQGYARVAEAAVRTIAAAVTDRFAAAHGRVPGSEFIVLALGRLGGGALTHASDLDLVYLFTGDHLATSDGAQPLGATHYYNRLAQRVSTGLSAATSAGTLYEVDTRLRPSGSGGPLAVSLESFARYQGEAAWTWEHMALTRARVVFGSPDAAGAVAAIIRTVLRRPRDRATLAREVVAMRAEMARHKPPAGPLDVKLTEGGLVDLEFVVHFLQLESGVGLDPDLARALAALRAAGLVEAGLEEAYALLTRLLVCLRLVAPTLGEPAPASRAIVARAAGCEDWPALLQALDSAKATVRRAWQRVVEAGAGG